MLLTNTTLVYYGSAAGAMVETEPSIEQSLSIKADKRLAASIQGGQIEPYIKMTKALIQYLNVTGLGELHLATWKKNARISLDVSIGATPSAFDISQAVAGMKIEGDYSLKDLIRIMSAVLVGKSTITDLGGGDATVTFRDVNDTANRVVASMTGSERTNVTKNP